MVAIELPTLSDGAVTLRPRQASDIDAVMAACQDPEIPRWTRVPSPYTREHGLEFVAASVREAAAGTAVGLCAVDPGDRLLGSVSLMAIDRERGYGEIGYWLSAPARGHGVATRAVRLLTEWGHRALGLERIEIFAHRDNAASQRVAERAGYERVDGLHPSDRTGVHEPVFVLYASRGR